jgi:hypothetical protein
MTTLAQPIAPPTALSRSLLAAAQQLEALGNHETNVIANRLRDHAAQAAMLEQRSAPTPANDIAKRLAACCMRVKRGAYAGYRVQVLGLRGVLAKCEIDLGRVFNQGVPETKRQVIEVLVEDLEAGE